jgi:hypothetical protein
MRQRLLTGLTLIGLSVLLALSWTTTVLAQAGSDGDGPDGDELGLPIVLGIAVIGYVGWLAFRRRSRKSS